MKTTKKINDQPLTGAADGCRIELPECGMFLGSGIYSGQAGYLARSGRTHTTWVPQSFSPVEMLDKIIADNQGNLGQLWGQMGGWGFNGANAPVTFARFHDLAEIGIEPPKPDWDNKKFLTMADWDIPQNYHDRMGAGVLKFLREATARGIYTTLLYVDCHPDLALKFREAGAFYLGYDFGERFSFRLEESLAAEQSSAAITLKTLADGLMARVREHVTERKEQGWGPIMATSSNFHIDYEIVAGADIPMVEDFAFSHLNMASALSRGLFRQFHLPMWGSHMAHEHYSWIPYSNPHKFTLLMAAFFQKYMSGCKMIVNESGNWFLQSVKAVDSPLFDMPRVELGSIRNCDPHLTAPYVEEAKKSFDLIDYHSPLARRYRGAISDFYDFLKTHGTPEGQPETTIAIAKGNYDLCLHEHSPNAAIAGMYTLAEEDSKWYESQPERGWEIVKDVFFPRPPVLAPSRNRFLSGTPWGPVDIVSFANDQIDAEFLSQNYRALLFSGWNTSSSTQYDLLLQYVQQGGTLFISIPHLCTRIDRNFTSYRTQDLVNGGDISELCGVKVIGKGRRFYWGTAPDRKGTLGFEFPRRFGIFTTCLGEIEIIDPEAEILAVDDEEMYPLLIRRRCGKGTVYFLNSWAYPGALDRDEGPGSTVSSKGLISYIYQQIARENRGSVWVSNDDHESELDFVAYSYFPESGQICLQNIDLENSHQFRLHQPKASQWVCLEAGEFRIIDAGDLSRQMCAWRPD